MDWFASTVLILGIGTCDGAGDYCARPLGEVRIEQSVVEVPRHSVWATATHLSEPGNENDRRTRDYGVNFFMLEYRFKLR